MNSTEVGVVPEHIEAPDVPPERQGASYLFIRSIFGHQLLWVLISSFLLAALYGRVVLLNLTSGVVGGIDDGYANVWNNWWVKTALLDLHRSAFYSDYIYYPLGASLRYHTLNPLNGLLTLPFNLIFGYLPVLNMFLVLAPVATLFCAFLLIRDLVGNPWAAFAGATLFTYANRNVLLFFTLGQTNLLTMHWLPLYLFLMQRALHGRPVWSATSELVGWSRGRWPVYAVFAVAALVAMSLTDWQYVMYAVLVTVLYFLFELTTRRTWTEKRTIFGRLAAIGGAYTAIVAFPLVIPMIYEAATSPWLNVSNESVWHSIDLLDLIGPGLGNPGYLAIGVAILGLLASWKRGNGEREEGLFWGLTALLFYLFTLGPQLVVNGKAIDIPLPYDLLQNLPVVNTGRDPGRFNIVALLGVSILVAFGLRAVLERLALLKRGPAAPARLQRSRFVIPGLVVTAFLSLALFGFMAAIGPASKVDAADWPVFYQEIAQDKEQYAILELPIYPATGRYNMYQVLHGKLRFVGWMARDHKQANPNAFVKSASLFRDFWMANAPASVRDRAYPQHDILTHTDYTTQGIPILNYYNTRYIIIYKEAVTPDDWSRMENVLHQVLGKDAKPYYEDNLMRVYKVPQAAPPSNPLTLDVGDGWGVREMDPNGTSFRWADNTVVTTKSDYLTESTPQLYTMNLRKEPVHAVLKFSVFTYKVPRTLRLALNGSEVASVQVKPEDGAKQVSVDLILPSGNNLLEFTSPEPALPTDDPTTDDRHLSFALENVSLEMVP